jgi:hypothetical protein
MRQHVHLSDQRPRINEVKLAIAILSLLCLAATSPIAQKLKLRAKDLSVLPLAPTIQASVTLAWDPIDDTNLLYYTIYEGGQSRVYTNQIQTTNTTCTFTNLQTGVDYFFTASSTIHVSNGDTLTGLQGAEVSWFLTYQPTGNRLVTLSQQWSPTGADPWQTIGPAMLFTNPMYPVMFFRQSITVTNQ